MIIIIQWLFHYGPRCRAHYSEPKCVGFYFFFVTRPHTGFLPAAAASTRKHRATARRPYRAFVPYYKNTRPQRVPRMNREPYTIIIILKFGTRDSVDRRVPTAEPLASQPAACWSRPVRHPSRRRPSVRDVRTVRSATSASPAASDARLSCSSCDTSFLRSCNFFSFFKFLLSSDLCVVDNNINLINL